MSITSPLGFRASGVTAGLKASGRSDVALVLNDGPLAVAAGVFTSNRVVAAPVVWSRVAVGDGVARAEDFTEIAFTGEAPSGQILAFRVTGHDGSRVTAERVA